MLLKVVPYLLSQNSKSSGMSPSCWGLGTRTHKREEGGGSESGRGRMMSAETVLGRARQSGALPLVNNVAPSHQETVI